MEIKKKNIQWGLIRNWQVFVTLQALSQYDSAARDLFELQKIEPKNTAAKKELDVVLDLCRKVSDVRGSRQLPSFIWRQSRVILLLFLAMTLHCRFSLRDSKVFLVGM